MSKSNPQLNLDNQICFRLYSASRQVTRLYQPLLKEIGLTYPQYIVLLILWEQDGLLVKEIGERAELNSNTLTPLLKRLAERGLVTRSKNPDDERQTFIYLTEAGKALEQSCTCIPAQMMAKAGLNMEQVQQLKQSLDMLLKSSAATP
ncbi:MULTISPECIES: MarR family winged helix-turn-helix transcriptional regulator [Pseudoalteromonas]|uniref:MarR family winged helix-turn-helix transcriptional regulator n=1 Tax=Pseudoalteromonas TaxID=53246 RepID=UPI0011086AF8|nr:MULTISPECIES: MarR family transcriptional regulator [Pseudoalteromonas]MCG9758594.1 MarR family transcriptional regulator [Pseudoalteromonas sp. Isolate6]NKC19687.1 MarR family transcriptional regulator [Pseudoalteromonas galatheae]